MRQTTDLTTRGLSSVRFWLIITSVILLCYWSGPFGTIDALPGGLRLVYWTVIVLSTSLTGLWAHALIRVQDWHDFARASAVGIIFGLLASGIVVCVSLALLDPIQKNPGPVALFFYSFPSTIAVFLTTVFFDRPRTADIPLKERARPTLFKRLNSYQAAESILALRAQDHYVEVITEQGAELCLIRLSDAISEAVPTKGLQIHRSHWVAISAINKLETKGSNVFAHLTDGTTLKVSQSKLKRLRQVLGQGN